LTTEIVPLCLNIMEISSELSKTVAIYCVLRSVGKAVCVL